MTNATEIYLLVVLRDRMAEDSIVKATLAKETELPHIKAEFRRAFEDVKTPLGLSPQDYYVEFFEIECSEYKAATLIDGVTFVVTGVENNEES
jgi:hypothetical protein